MLTKLQQKSIIEFSLTLVKLYNTSTVIGNKKRGFEPLFIINPTNIDILISFLDSRYGRVLTENNHHCSIDNNYT